MNAIEQRTSHAIAWLRLPLMVGVVLLHNQYTTFQQLPQPNVVSVLSFLEQTLNLGVLRVCVPFFFLISGYLIVSSGGDDARAWPQKMKRRFFTLFVPYVCWGSITLLAALALHQATWHDVLPSFWNYHGQGTPLHFQFWFLRDLMCLSLVYPLWVWLAKGTRSLSRGALGALSLQRAHPLAVLFLFGHFATLGASETFTIYRSSSDSLHLPLAAAPLVDGTPLGVLSTTPSGYPALR